MNLSEAVRVAISPQRFRTSSPRSVSPLLFSHADGRAHQRQRSHFCHPDPDVTRGSSLHPGVTVIPAAITVAERHGNTGRALLESIVAGYEVVMRVGEALDPAATTRGFSIRVALARRLPGGRRPRPLA